MSAWAPSMADDPALVAWFARMQRLAASPGEARIISRAMVDLDVRDALPRIRVPTLVMHRPKELVWDVRHSRYLAEHIPGARYVELEGSRLASRSSATATRSSRRSRSSSPAGAAAASWRGRCSR